MILKVLVACVLPLLPDLAQDEKPAPPLARVVEVERGEDGKPFPGATVEAHGLPGGVVAKTMGRDGTARFEEMPRKGVVFVARAPGFACAFHEPGAWSWFRNEEDEDLDGDGVTRMRLSLQPGSVMEGRVLTPEGEPIPGAIVEARQEAHATDMTILGRAPYWSAVADAEGRFRVREHWDASWVHEHKVISMDITARAKGRVHGKVETWPREGGKYEPVEFRLGPAGTFRGTVTGPDGKPAADALVTAYPSDFGAFAALSKAPRRSRKADAEEFPVMEVRTDAAGRFAMEEARPGARYFVLAEAEAPDPADIPGFPRAVSRSPFTADVGIEKPGQETTCDLRLRRLAEVRVRGTLAEREWARNRSVELIPPPGVRPWVYRSEEDGVTIFREVDPGRWTLKVDAFGWAPHEEVVEVVDGETKGVTIPALEVTVRLERGASLEGMLVDDEGKPVPGAALYAYAVNPEDPDDILSDLGYEEARTDGGGRFRFDGLRPGPTAIGIGGGESRYRQDGYFHATAPATGVNVQVSRASGLRIRIAAPEGAKPPARAVVFLTHVGGPHAGRQDLLEEDLKAGALDLGDVLPGTYTVAVDIPGYAPALRRVEVKAGGITEPEPFVLEDGLSLPGRIVDGAGKPLPGARIRPWGNEERGATSGDDGTFSVLHLGPGRVTLSVIAPGCAEAILDARVGEAGSPIVIPMTAGGLVRGTVRTRKGEVPEYAVLEFFPASAKDRTASRWRTEAKEGGTYSLRLPAGKYRFVPAFGRFDREPVFIDVPEGGEVVTDLLSD